MTSPQSGQQNVLAGVVPVTQRPPVSPQSAMSPSNGLHNYPNDTGEIALQSQSLSNATAPALRAHTSPSYNVLRDLVPSINETEHGSNPVNMHAARRMNVRPSICKKTKPAKPKTNRQPAAAGGRGNGFTQKEIDSLLDLLEEHLPVGRDEWEVVKKLHESRFPEHERTVDSLKRKFAGLYRKTIPTGDPNIPQDVRRSKHIRSQMVERIDMRDGDDAEKIADESFEPTDTMTEFPSSNGNHDTSEPEMDLVSTAPQASTPSGTPSLSERLGPSARPLVRKRPGVTAEKGDDLMSIYKMSLMEEQKRRAEEHERRMQDMEDERSRREEERHRREEERSEERERRAEENKRQERFMEMMMLMTLGRAPGGANSAPSREENTDKDL